MAWILFFFFALLLLAGTPASQGRALVLPTCDTTVFMGLEMRLMGKILSCAPGSARVRVHTAAVAVSAALTMATTVRRG